MEISFNLGGSRHDQLGSLLAALPDDAFASARRSTLPLIDYWREPRAGVEEIGRLIGTQLIPPVELHFEYAVLPTRGRGKASFTDLMIISGNAAIAIEAKFDEPIYDSVTKWLGNSPPNRVEVLSGWLDAINQASGVALTIPDVVSVPYQLIHRTASVCSLPQSTRAVVYQTFGDPPTNHYAEAMRRLDKLGVTSSIKFYEMNVRTKPTPELIEIQRSVKKGTPELATRLRKALSQRNLFQFIK